MCITKRKRHERFPRTNVEHPASHVKMELKRTNSGEIFAKLIDNRNGKIKNNKILNISQLLHYHHRLWPRPQTFQFFLCCELSFCMRENQYFNSILTEPARKLTGGAPAICILLFRQYK